MLGVEHLGHHAQAVAGPGPLQQHEAGLAEALEGIGAGAGLEDAAAKQVRTGAGDGGRRLGQLCRRLHRTGPGGNDEGRATHLHRADDDTRPCRSRGPEHPPRERGVRRWAAPVHQAKFTLFKAA